jgi:hypothetical protein
MQLLQLLEQQHQMLMRNWQTEASWVMNPDGGTTGRVRHLNSNSL